REQVRVAPHRIAVQRRFELEDGSPQSGQNSGAVWSSDALRQVDDAQAAQRGLSQVHARRGRTRSASNRMLRVACSTGIPPKFIHSMTCWTPVVSLNRWSSSTTRDGSPKRATLSRYHG